MATLKINGEDRTYEAPDDTPLLWVIREELKLTGRKRHIRQHRAIRAVADARLDHPGQEFRIPFDVHDEIEQLLRGVCQKLSFGAGRHEESKV